MITFGVVEKPNLKQSKKAKALAIDGSGNTYVTGHSQGVDTGINDYATIKYDSDGTDAWVTRYDGQASPVSRRRAWDKTGVKVLLPVENRSFIGVSDT